MERTTTRAITNHHLESRTIWRWNLTSGILTSVLGIVILAWPGRTLLALAVVLGVQLILFGALLIVSRLAEARTGGQVLLGIVGGTLATLAGVAVLGSPDRTVAFMALVLGVAWFTSGLMEFIEALVGRDLPMRGWNGALGILSAIAGVVVISAPIQSVLALAVWSGIFMIVQGSARSFAAIRFRQFENSEPDHHELLPQQPTLNPLVTAR